MDTLLEQIPTVARRFGNLNIMVEEGIIERTVSNSPFRQKSLRLTLGQMREELAGPNPSPLEKLGAERIASCWLQLHYAELIYNQELPKLTLERDAYHQKRLDRLHKRYLSAMRSLATGSQAIEAEGGANQQCGETANQHRNTAPVRS